MSLRLKNESSTFPPGGLQFHERQLGWKNWINDPNTVWSWDGLVNAIYNLRRANAARFPKLSSDRAVIRRQISEQNANRIASMPGAETYLASAPIAQGGQSPNPPVAPPASVSQGVAGRLDRMARGAASQMEWWLTNHGQPVPREQAEHRAVICCECPKNNPEGIDAWFTRPAAALIRKKLEARSDLKLETSHDSKLGICEVCDCVLQNAVHEPLEIKKKHMRASELSNLWSACWILSESNEPKPT